jgi:hypothetical protein
MRKSSQPPPPESLPFTGRHRIETMTVSSGMSLDGAIDGRSEVKGQAGDAALSSWQMISQRCPSGSRKYPE